MNFLSIVEMKITVTTGLAKEWFVNHNRGDYFSWDGLETLLNYYDDIDENIEFDVIAICCDCTEFGKNVDLTMDDFINDYSYLKPRDNSKSKEQYTQDLIECLEEKTTVLHVSNGNIIVFNY